LQITGVLRAYSFVLSTAFGPGLIAKEELSAHVPPYLNPYRWLPTSQDRSQRVSGLGTKTTSEQLHAYKKARGCIFVHWLNADVLYLPVA